MIRKLCFTVCLALIVTLSLAQTGNYFLTHYAPDIDKIDRLCFDMAMDQRGLIYFANKAGVLEFDGKYWRLISTPGAVYALSTGAQSTIFVAGLSGYGKLEPSSEGLVFKPLSGNHPDAANLFESLPLKDKIYFANRNNLYVVNQQSGETELVIPTPKGTAFSTLFEVMGKVYVTTESDNLFEVAGSQLKPAQLNASSGNIIFSSSSADNRYLLGTTTGQVFEFSATGLREIILKDADYLQSNVLVGGAWVNNNLVALSTLRGGVQFVDVNTGETTEITNYYTGLPDNEVFALMGDNNQGIWAAHDYGFTRIAPSVPFRSYNHYPGLNGNLLCVHSAGDEVYVGTALGLFKLVRDAVYEEEVYYVSKTRNVEVSSRATEEVVIQQEQREKAKRGLFKKRKSKEADPTPAAKPATPTTKRTEAVTVREKRTRKILKGLQYRYKPVEGISGKVTHALAVDGKLIVAGLDGVFEVNGLTATPFLREPVKSVFPSPSTRQLLVSTYNEAIRTFMRSASGWQPTAFLPDTIQEDITYMFEDKLQNIWLCGRSGLLKVELVDGEITDVSEVPYARPSIDETVGLAVGNDVYIVTSGEFQRYNAAKHNLSRYDSLPGTRKYFASAGAFWFHDGHRWRTIDRRLSAQLKLEWLGLFSDIRYLTAPAEGKGLWVITASNELFRFIPDSSSPFELHPLFLREVRSREAKWQHPKKMQLEEEEGTIIFEFTQPEYVGTSTIEYRYMVAGLMPQWSDWSINNNVVPFPYLPPGDYQIKVQSKDLFGKITELDTIDFSVLPPYWRRPWFYAFEVMFFSFLVLVTVKLSVANSKYRPLSRILSLLTVIMFIQLVQTSVYAYINVKSSPVVDFFIQVCIAMLVLPLEVRLRNFLQGAAEGKYEVSKLIGVTPKDK